jgi:nucleoside phosphorylase/tetratricopeptide (TPR) repeat protein
MKLTEFYQGEATDPSSRKRRLQMLLSAWLFPRLVYWAQPGVPPPGTALTAEDLLLWFEILRVARPVPPRTDAAGLETFARLRGVPVDDLVSGGIALVIEDRVALRSQAPGLGLLGHCWSLLVPAYIDGQPTEAVLRKRFREVEAHGDEVIAWGSWFNCTDSIAALVGQALTADTTEALARTWEVSLALDLEYRFLPALPAAPAKALATLLGEKLLGAAPRLAVDTDLRLLRFAFGRADGSPVIPSLQLPASRLARLLDVDRFFDHAHHQFSDWYYDEVASAFARTADDLALVTVLRELAPGSALIAALDAVRLDRPEFIAAYTGHPSFHSEGAFALIQLPQQAQLAHAHTHQLDLQEEWLQAQQLGRELLLLGDPSKDWPSVIALGIHDESLAIGRQHSTQAPIIRRQAHYDDAPAPWAKAVADGERGPPIVEALEQHLQARVRHSDATIIFALRLLRPLRESGKGALATRLATAIVDAYVAGLSLDVEVLAIRAVLRAYGGLLADLRHALDADGPTWRKFVRPFDPARYLELARADRPQTVSSEQVNPSFDVPRIMRAHAEALVALASAIDAFDEPLQAALELCDADRLAALPEGAFSWMGLARISNIAGTQVGEPLFEAVGLLFARIADRPPWLEAFLRNESHAHILASLVVGLGASHPLAETIRPKLHAALNALLADDHGVALGHALEVANILQRADMPRDAERFARRALEIVEEVPGARASYGTVARALLAGALAQQEMWPELLAFEQDRNAIVLSPHARFIENMRALALMECGRLTDAHDVLERVLAVDANDKAALVNRTFIYLRAKNWTKAIAAAAEAKPRLSGDDLDRLLLNEANAREQLGDAFSAANLLDALSGRAKARADVVESRERLRRGEHVVAPVGPLAVSAAAQMTAAPIEPKEGEARAQIRALPGPPADVIDIAIITALEEEYTAVRERLTDWREVVADGGQYPNVYGWVTGKIPKADGTGAYRVVVAWAGSSGNVRTAITTLKTIDRWQPRYLLFCGIAGGLPKEALRQGDLVLSQSVWYYEYGKVDQGTFKPRHRDSFRVDPGLLSSARTFNSANAAWKRCGVVPPASEHDPKLVVGMIGSGEKVIDDRAPDFVRAVLEERPELRAIEMEAAGACQAVETANAEGKQVGFLMVRGISDMPGAGSHAAAAGTTVRDNWKPYVCALAAHFIVSWVAASWPALPRAAAP